MAEIKAILFDLGGVLVDFTGLEAVRPLMADDPGAEAVKAKWGASQAIHDFEHGRIDAAAFAAAFVAEWRLTVPAETFMPTFESWVSGPRPGVTDLIAALRRRLTVGCLSNTNAAHWRKIMDLCGLAGHLDRPYGSFQVGMMKPSAALFDHVCADLGVAPDQVLFFDDGMGNVEGARAAGLEAEHATSVADLRNALGARGLI